MRRTTTIPNRFTTFIQSWRGKTGSLLLGLFVLLFLSCRDDAAYIGFAKEPRLNAHYVDIPLNPSVLQFDGLLTRNSVDDPVTRILMGHYNDPQFGIIDAKGFVNISAPTTLPAPTVAATLDSLVLQLKLDYYYYGSPDFSVQHMKVYEVLDTIKDTQGYYTSSKVAVSADAIGEKTFFINPTEFNDAIVVNNDTDTSNNKVFNIRIPIQGNMGANMLSDMVNDLAVYSDAKIFMGKYKGFSFIMDEGDKIVGINPKYNDAGVKAKDSKLSLYYTEAGVQTRADFLLYNATNGTFGVTYPVVSFSTITTDRSLTLLNGIKAFEDFTPGDNQFYVQGGTALLTKFDLHNFYQYMDTVDHAVFNSAQLMISNVSLQRAPFNVQLRVLNAQNHFRSVYIDSLVKGVETSVVDPYMNAILSGITPGLTGTSSTVDVKADQGVTIPVTSDPFQVGNIFITEFIQQVYNHRHDPRRIFTIALMSSEGEFQKSVNSLVLDPYITLRLYYSKPVVKIR